MRTSTAPARLQADGDPPARQAGIRDDEILLHLDRAGLGIVAKRFVFVRDVDRPIGAADELEILLGPHPGADAVLLPLVLGKSGRHQVGDRRRGCSAAGASSRRSIPDSRARIAARGRGRRSPCPRHRIGLDRGGRRSRSSSATRRGRGRRSRSRPARLAPAPPSRSPVPPAPPQRSRFTARSSGTRRRRRARDRSRGRQDSTRQPTEAKPCFDSTR